MLHILDPLNGSPKAVKGYRHLGWRILQAWWKETIFCLLLAGVYSVAEFASVLGVNRLLYYLENKGEGAIIKPWVWILFIGVGPYIQG